MRSASSRRQEADSRELYIMPLESLDISEARRQFSHLDKKLESRPIIEITRHNKKAFAVININYLETIMETMEVLSDPETTELLQRSIEDIQEGRLHDHEDVLREFLSEENSEPDR